MRTRHTMVYSRADIKSAPIDALPFGAEVNVVSASKDFSQIQDGGYIFSRHLAPTTRP